MMAQGEAAMPKGILIAGYYGFGNTGDEAILSAILKDLRALRPDLDLHVVSGNPSETASRYRVRAVLWSDIQAIIEHAQACDLILLGGGGIFHDYWGAQANTLLTAKHAGIPFFSGFPLLAWLLDKPCMIYAAGVGPLFSDEGKELTRLAFELVDVATVRDAESRQILQTLGLSVDKIRVTADPAFNLPIDEAGARTVLQAAGVVRGKPAAVGCGYRTGSLAAPGCRSTGSLSRNHRVFAALRPFPESPGIPSNGRSGRCRSSDRPNETC